MKTKMKLIFPAAIAAALMTFSQANAANEPESTNSITTGTNKTAATSMTALFGDPVIAKGKGVEIKQSALDEVVLGIKSAYAARNQTIPPQQMPGIEATLLNRLIQIQLLLQKATAADKAEGKKKADSQLATLLEKAGSQETFDRQLKAVGMTSEELRTKITQEATATAALNRELNITVSDADVTNFYAAHPADFEQPETVHVRHILLFTIDPTTQAPLSAEQIQANRKEIEGILKRVKAGEDFAKLAEQYSQDPGSKVKGGELPPFGRGQMVPQFEAAAFSMPTNTVSDVITTDFGFHIIKVLDKAPAQKIAFATVSDKIKDYLLQQKTQKLAPPYLAALSKGADVEILDPELKAAAAALAAAITNAPPEMP
ncbi:MAG: peptidylprolyl isomerase [Limisphaerales bacterium]